MTHRRQHMRSTSTAHRHALATEQADGHDLVEMMELCFVTFASPALEVRVDVDANTVWVRCPGTQRSVGLQAAMLDRHDDPARLLSRIETKLMAPQ